MGQAQPEQIAQMRGWLRRWYGREHRPSLPPVAPGKLRRLRALDGNAFDREMARVFTIHHASLFDDAQECMRVAAHARLRHLCETMYQAQQTESVQLGAVVAFYERPHPPGRDRG